MSQSTKRHSLTRMGDRLNRRIYYRRDANCPATMIYRPAPAQRHVRTKSWISNISEGGVLLLVDNIAGPVGGVYVLLPGLAAKVAGTVVRQGELTLAVEFDEVLPTRLVDWIARLEPRGKVDRKRP